MKQIEEEFKDKSKSESKRLFNKFRKSKCVTKLGGGGGRQRDNHHHRRDA